MFDFDTYEKMLDQHSIELLWNHICFRALATNRPDLIITNAPSYSFLDDSIDALFSDISLSTYSEIYEYGLAHVNKESKKKLGQYYTPEDTCEFMASLLGNEIYSPSIKRIIEPCCGCGNLLMPLFKDSTESWKSITEKLILFDIDETAILVTKTRLIAKYAPCGGTVSVNDISSLAGDFLKQDIVLGEGDVVIMNPPYGKCDGNVYEECATHAINDLYPLFVEKVSSAERAVSIVPQSFIGSNAYESLRGFMSDKSHGRIWAYDNVPSPMFNGRKHGIFNTNTSNSVRAAIIDSRSGRGGFKISPLIRWKAEERPALFEHSMSVITGVEKTWEGDKPWGKVPKELERMHDSALLYPPLSTLISKTGPYTLDIPTSPRYYTSAAKKNLDRGMKHVIRFESYENMCLAYLILNSSWAYSWWRFYDGGITLTKTLLMDIPVPQEHDIDKVIKQAEQLFEKEETCTVYKKNAGKMNENVKFDASDINSNNRILFPNARYEELSALKNMHRNSITQEESSNSD